ncbi:hypothetical protein HGI09_30840 [Streptomyces collinus]|nr:hypothetical protein HGI10_33280 [Streptomyces collinus]UJA15757.1 hypothetical protein HGI09_30840 [Streptomyces collinus]
MSREVRNLRPRRAPLNRSAMARAVLATSLPPATGLAAGQPAYGALASMGALSGVLDIAVPQLFGALGVEAAFGPETDPAGRARMRRRLYRDLSRALTEPPPTGRRAAAW